MAPFMGLSKIIKMTGTNPIIKLKGPKKKKRGSYLNEIHLPVYLFIYLFFK